MAKQRKTLKSLEIELESFDSYLEPKVALEQYHTPPKIAATVLHLIDLNYDDIEGKNILDLGCGCGILGLGSIIRGAANLVAVDIDQSAIDIARQNLVKVGLPTEKITFLTCNVCELTREHLPKEMAIDTVITNPPFGTWQQVGMDYVFVQKGLELGNVVYSLHKSSTRDFWKKAKEFGVNVETVEEDLPFNIKRTFRFHKEGVRQVHVDLIRFSKRMKQI